jgi:hypothetical protein
MTTSSYLGDIWRSSNTTLWTNMTPSPSSVVPTPFSARVYGCGVSFQGKIWYMGGLDASGAGPLHDVWSSPDGSVWTHIDTDPISLGIQDAPWGGRSLFSCQVFNGKMWVMGGRGVNGIGSLQDVWSSPDGVVWTHVDSDQFSPGIQDAPWGARDSFATAIINNKMWVMGGSPNFGNFFNDVWSTADGLTWTQVTPHAQWSPRYRPQAIGFNNILYLMGGGDLAGVTTNDVWASLDGINWTLIQPHASWAPRADFQLVIFNKKLLVLAGTSHNTSPTSLGLNDIWSSPDGITWTGNTARMPWPARYGHSLVVTP